MHADSLPVMFVEATKKAVRLEWISIAYLFSGVILLYLTMGASQAMKTAWIDDMLSLIPPIVFLLATHIRRWKPTEQFPYGFQRVVSIAFLVASLALLSMGLILVYDSIIKLIRAEHPSIGLMNLFGWDIWAGWPMLFAAIYSGLPAVFLGRKKIPLGRILHNKALYADAMMNKADWLTGAAAATGVIGIGFGLWWADAVAALVISTDILWDGFKHTKEVTQDLVDRVPRTVDTDTEEPVVARIKEYLSELPWITDSKVMLREEGEFFFGHALVVPVNNDQLIEKVDRAIKTIRGMDWRVKGFVLTPVKEIKESDFAA